MGVDLRELVLPYKKEIALEELRGIAAVDAFNALFQFITIIRQPDGTPLMDKTGRVTSHLSGILFRTANLMEKGIKPLFIFDGTPPPFKEETVQMRRDGRALAETLHKEALARGDIEEAYKQARAASRIDSTIIASAKRLITLLGLPVVDAPSEGEAQAAYMTISGDVGYAVSQDYDTLLFGSPALVRNLTVSGKRKMHGRSITVNPEKIFLDDLLFGQKISREELIQIGILVGTDFNRGCYGIGVKTGIKIVKEGGYEKTLKEKMPDFDPVPVEQFFLHPPVTKDYSLEWKTPDFEGIRAMLCEEYDFGEERVNRALSGLGLKIGQKTLDSWF